MGCKGNKGVSIKMKVWKDKKGNKLTAKEFIQRWKEGIERVTPLQQTQNQINGYIVVLIGELWGIYYALASKTLWLATILIGGYMISKAQLTGIYQKKLMLKQLEGGVNG